ncbi:hypothetical protein FALCPG4_018129 [Fusarium falciforme]
MVDNEQQITHLEKAIGQNPWNIFIKIDVGSHRAGVPTASPALQRLVQRAEASPAVNIYGIYCHAGHSYGGRSRDDAESLLKVEISSVLETAKLLPANRNVVVSIGSTPTAHVVESLRTAIPANVKLELHAGQYTTLFKTASAQ